jgi:FlaA1/EpsC-like NDP-sugar epimerase
MIIKIAIPFLALPRSVKRVIVVGVDVTLCGLSVWLALCLRSESWLALNLNQWLAVVLSISVAIPVFFASGLYRAIFRYAGLSALMAVTRAMIIYSILYAFLLTALDLPNVPRTLVLIQPVFLLLLVGSSRALGRFWLSGEYLSSLKRGKLTQVLIYGAGAAGHQLAVALATSMEMRAVGFLDDDVELQGHVLDGLPIYSPTLLKNLVDCLSITDVLLAIPSANRQRRNEILNVTRQAQVLVRTLPSFIDLAKGNLHLSDLRELDIEDLLGRNAVLPDTAMLDKNVRGKVVLVTGAGGSIGSELCRQIIKLAPSKLLLLELNEFSLYSIHQDLLQLFSAEDIPEVQLIPLLASVRDEDRLREIMSTWNPHTLYHAAAYKHVPLVEHNPAEGIKNNVLGTLTAAKVAAEHGVRDFVLISTDKAVRPTNIMGASKRFAEMVLQALAASAKDLNHSTCFSMVRFGNVLGSSGSVVPLFRKQIKENGPITLTHAEITRFFMTIPEAAQLVIQAGAMARGGDVFVLDMGEPVRIIDLGKLCITPLSVCYL